MKLEEAIKLLQDEIDRKAPVFGNDYWDATRLGIEAIKRLEELRLDPLQRPQLLLPGETKEE